jgi:ubiquinone/menaquinone biosynthesis C-methylase UbiE
MRTETVRLAAHQDKSSSSDSSIKVDFAMQVNTSYEPYSQEPEYIEANRALLTTLPAQPIHRVLDLACGTGLMSDLLLEIKPGIVVNGVDISTESLDIGRRLFRDRGLLVDSQDALDAAAQAGKSAVLLKEGSATDLPFADATFDLAMMGNAIHLMPDKDAFLQGVARVLVPGGLFTFNSVFFTGTFAEGTEPLYTEWMKEAVVLLNEKNVARMKAGEKPIPRQRGKAGHAFDKGWMDPDEWAQALTRNGFEVDRVYKRPVAISQRGLELVGAYGGLAEVLMSGYPVDIASECLQEAAGRAFEKLAMTEVTRYWLEVTAKRA